MLSSGAASAADMLVTGPGAAPRTTEYRTQQRLSLDVGQIAGRKPNMVAVWGGYHWWKNKFALDPMPSGLCRTLESTGLAGATRTFQAAT